MNGLPWYMLCRTGHDWIEFLQGMVSGGCFVWLIATRIAEKEIRRLRGKLRSEDRLSR